MYFVGIDAGSSATKAVLLKENSLVSWVINPTGWSPKETALKTLHELLDKAGVEETAVKNIVATGYGRVGIDFANRTITEITCHALGGHYFFPDNETIIDIGGQDSKIIQVSKEGKVLKFTMNDKCAAGTGRFLQVMANSLGLDLADMAQVYNEEAVEINSMCTVFAESEVISLLASGTQKDKIITGLYRSVAKRISAMAGNFNMRKITFTGGTAKNFGLRKALEKELRQKLSIPPEPQIIGALGAALCANK